MNFQYEDKLITIYFTDRQLDDFMEDYNMEGQYLKEYMNKNNADFLAEKQKTSKANTTGKSTITKPTTTKK